MVRQAHPFAGSSLGVTLSLAAFAAWVYGCALGEMQIGPLRNAASVCVCVCVCVRYQSLSHV